MNGKLAIVALATAATMIASPALADERTKFLADASKTFQNFLRDPEMAWIQSNLSRAQGVIIAPQVVKAGFIIGGSGGRAVLITRDSASGQWRGPVFYNLATASIGFQAGLAASEVVMLVMSEKGVNSLMSTSLKLGGDASIAAGPVGAGAKSDVTSDFVSFSRSKGIYGGINLDGTAVSAHEAWNRLFYGKPVTPPDVLIRANVSNAKGKPLVDAVAKAAK
jgi:lipid-binding SYLF domain-containing protein